MKRAESLVVAAVVLHLVLSIAHGVVHGVAPVHIPVWQLGFVLVTLFAAPILGAGLLVRGRRQFGAWLVLVGTLAGFAFEAVAHFGVTNPDHVSQVGHVAFGPTAVGSTLGTGVAAVVAVWYLRRHTPTETVRSAGESST